MPLFPPFPQGERLPHLLSSLECQRNSEMGCSSYGPKNSTRCTHGRRATPKLYIYDMPARQQPAPRDHRATPVAASLAKDGFGPNAQAGATWRVPGTVD